MNPFLRRVVEVRELERVEDLRRLGPLPGSKARLVRDFIDVATLDRELRRLGLSRGEAAELCGVRYGTFNRYLREPPEGWREHVERELYLEPEALRGSG